MRTPFFPRLLVASCLPLVAVLLFGLQAGAGSLVGASPYLIIDPAVEEAPLPRDASALGREGTTTKRPLPRAAVLPPAHRLISRRDTDSTLTETPISPLPEPESSFPAEEPLPQTESETLERVPERILRDRTPPLPDSTPPLLQVDTTHADSALAALPADSVAADTLELARTYFGGALARTYAASVSPPRRPRILNPQSRSWQRTVNLDSTSLRGETKPSYIVRERVGDADVRVPVSIGLSGFLDARRRTTVSQGFRDLALQRSRQINQDGGLGRFTVSIPGGEQSAFRTIFGKNEVDLRVNGFSTVDLGIGYDQNELQSAVTGRGGSYAPDFGQDLNLNVVGTIGDKLKINVNYDTESQFDFENQVSLVYEGYEDDIIQRIEAGNVFLQTPSELIRGGQRLFGIRSDLQFGPLAVTTVASQQDAETKEVNIEGGSQSTPFSRAPFEYEDNAHFFLGYFFHNWWDRAHEDPTNPTLPPNFSQIIGLEVWKHDLQAIQSEATDDNTISVIALADLGEATTVLQGGQEYFEAVGEGAPLPSPDEDQYDEQDLEQFRTNSENVDFSQYDLADADIERNRFRKLNPGRDYTFDPSLGWLSLNSALTEDQALAVAFQYRTASGEVVTVGDYNRPPQSNTTNGERAVFKLLRNSTPAPADAAWDLTMRNIYRIGGSSINPDALTLDLTYRPPGSTSQSSLPGLTLGDGLTLLQVLGLDRTDAQGVLRPDNRFDFRSGYTIDADNGRIIFPTRRPFGNTLSEVLRGNGSFNGNEIAVTYQNTSEEEALENFSFEELYDLKPQQAAQRFSRLRNYAIEGEFRGATQSVFDVGFNLIEGTVRVTADGVELTEGTDYVVNYNAGTVEIRNPLYLTGGKQIRVSVEQNKLFSFSSKTLLGLRADYRVSDRVGFGTTWMRLSEQPQTQKFRIGEEALQNSIIGFDARYEAEPRWITRALDALPLIQTRAPSRVELRGEIARLNPGSPQTFAFEQALRAYDADAFSEDELQGVSYIDDFESSENAFTAPREAVGWRLAAPPTGARPNAPPATADTDVTEPNLATNWRGLWGWYSIDNATYLGQNDLLDTTPLTRATRPVTLSELFPERELTQQERQQPLSLLDVYFDPTRRGPYNFNGDLSGTFAASPKDVWGGMVRSISPSYTDFEGRNNIEFVQFLVSPLGGRDGTEAVSREAVLYLDLGAVTEDVLPNNAFNTEDGLIDAPPTENQLDSWGRLPTGQATNTIDFNEDTGRTEDLGLDGLPSRVDLTAGEPYDYDERVHFSDFLASLPSGTPEAARAALDPAADDFHHYLENTYFEDPTRFPGGASLQERFAQYRASYELNSPEAYREIVRSGQGGFFTFPNSEDINNNVTLDTEESFWRYRLPLHPDSLRNSPFFENEIETDVETWYLVRIPVRTEDRQAVGPIQDFSRIETMRLWTNGHERPATMRFASFEFVGSQWQKSERVGIVDDDRDDGGSDAGAARLFIESINNEESRPRYRTPPGTVINQDRSLQGNNIASREGALVFRVEELGEGQARGIYKPYTTQQLDLTKYSNLRLDVHGEGFERADSVRVFLRIGSDETENYYEIEQPLYPFDSDRLDEIGEEAKADSLWQVNVPLGGGEQVDLNPINVVLSALNQLKASRDQAGVPTEERFTRPVVREGSPPGARLTIRGTPSIQNINTLVLGVRNAGESRPTPLDEVELWFNEMRVSGFQDDGGASGFLTATAQLADFASINARMSFTEDGFGGLGDGLGARDFTNRFGYTLTSTLNVDKLLPERFGWNIPLSLSLVENQSIPRFAPRRGDVRVSELVDQALQDSTLSEEERQIAAEEIRRSAETTNNSQTVRASVSKSGSESPWLKYTLDGLTLSYSTSDQESRSPSQLFSDNRSWRTDLSYSVSVPRPQTVRPLWFTKSIPVLGVLGSLQLNLLPQRVRLSTGMDRSIVESRQRPLGNENTSEQVLRFLYPEQNSHSFNHNRVMDIQHNPFSFLQLSYRSNTRQSLDRAGVNETFEVLVRDSTGATRVFPISRDSAQAAGSIVWQEYDIENEEQLANLEFLGGTRPDLGIRPFGRVIADVFGGRRSILTESYTQSLDGSVRISTNNVDWLSWLQLQPVSYSTNYNWDYTPVSSRPDLTVAGVSTNVQIQAGVQLRPQEFFRLLPFYRKLEEGPDNSRDDANQTDNRSPSPAGRPQRPPKDPNDDIPSPRLGDEEQEAETNPDTESSDPKTPARRPDIGIDADSLNANRDGRRSSTEAESGEALLKLVGAFGRRLVLAVTGVQDVNVTYRGGLSSRAGGLRGGAYSLFSALTGDAPPLGYRLGIDRRLPLGIRFADADNTLRLQDAVGDQHSVEARTTLTPLPNLRVALTWQTDWNRNDLFALEYNASEDRLFEQEAVQRGGGEATVLALGGNYDALLQSQVDRLNADIDEGETIEGRLVSDYRAPNGIAADFRSEFARGFGSFGPEGLLSLPMPRWEITYSGLSSWPLLQRITQQINLRHAYFTTNQTDYLSVDRSQPLTRVVPGANGPIPIVAPAVSAEASTLTVNERLSPLLGLSVTWAGNIQTDLNWNQSNLYTLQASNANLIEKNVSDLRLTVSYTKSGGFRLFGRRFDNRVRLELTASTSNDVTTTRSIGNDLEALRTGQARQAPQPRVTNRLSVWPRISYALSRQVNLDLFFRYDRTDTESTTQPGTETIDGGVSVRINFSN